MAVREKTRESRPPETAKTPKAARAPFAPVVSHRPLVTAHKGDAAARARASVVMQKHAGNARATAMINEVSARTLDEKKVAPKINVAPPLLVQVSQTTPPKSAASKEASRTVVTTKLNVGTVKSPETKVAPAPSDTKELPPAVSSEEAPLEGPKTITPEVGRAAKPEEEKKESKKEGTTASPAKEDEKEKPKPRSAREAVGPAVAGVRTRATAAHKKSPPRAAITNAELSAKEPATEGKRKAATATVVKLEEGAGKAPNVERQKFVDMLVEAIDRRMGEPKTESEAVHVMKEGAKEANAEVSSHLASQRKATETPLRDAAKNEVAPAAEGEKVEFKPEEIGAAPKPVSAAPVVPESIPDERLDCSSDRDSTDQAMAENNVSKDQLEKGNEPAFKQTLDSRSEAEANEAKLPGNYRETEKKIQGRTHAIAAKELAGGLGEIHGSRELHVKGVVGQQTGTKDKGAAERTRITNEINGIKERTRTKVNAILMVMETIAPMLFTLGLNDAERIYGNVFDDEKGGLWNWATNWGDDWEELIESSLKKAKVAYKKRVREAIITVADFVDGKLGEARAAVEAGRKEVDTYVQNLADNVKKYGVDAQKLVEEDFTAMDGEIDQRRDTLIEALVDQYKASYERMTAMEEKLREENKSLWQRIYDATIGLIKKIIAFKDMLVSILRKAADLILDIISDPIGFLGNLIDAVGLGLNNFIANLPRHLMKGLMAWLFGAIGKAGLELPESFDLPGIVNIILQILGLTYANFRKRAVDIVGEPVVSAIEKTAEVFKVIMTEGIPGLWRMIKDKVLELKSMVVDAIWDYIKEKVITAGITWIIGLMNPASAFFKACKAIYDIIVFFIERGSQIIELINAIIDSVAAIVKGNIGAAAQKVEDALAKAIPVAIGFLASLLGLGDISGAMRKIIDKAQEPINKAIDFVINLAAKGVKALGKLFTGGKDKKKKTKEDEVPHGDHLAIAKKVVSELKAVGKDDKKKDYKALREEKEEQAKQLELAYASKLEPKIGIKVVFENKEKGEEDHEIDFKVVIAPNTTEVPGAVVVVNDDDFELLRMEVNDRLFAEEEIVRDKLVDTPTADKLVRDGVKNGKLFVLKPRPRDPCTKIDLFSFNKAKAEPTHYGGRRNDYGFDNAKIPVATEIEILKKGLMSPPPPGMESKFSWYKTAALYKCKRTGEENLKYDDIDLGHDDSVQGASEYWNDIGHEQTFKENLDWNNDPKNYWGPEKSGKSRGSGSQAPLFRIPAKYFSSNKMWW
jgi:hypothetical protein